MRKSLSAHRLLKPALLLIATGLLSACQNPTTLQMNPNLQFKSTVDAPATPSIIQAYMDIADEMIKDSTDIIAMDRTIHGIRPTLDTNPPQQLAANDDVKFDRYQSMYFKVYKVEVVDQYKMPISTNYDEHLLVTPNDAVHEWANRLRPTGGVNKLQVVITDARMIPASAATGDQKRYDGSLSIELRICNREGVVLSSITSSAIQSASISDANRKAALNEMLSRLIDSTNGDLETKMTKDFSLYIDRAKV